MKKRYERYKEKEEEKEKMELEHFFHQTWHVMFAESKTRIFSLGNRRKFKEGEIYVNHGKGQLCFDPSKDVPGRLSREFYSLRNSCFWVSSEYRKSKSLRIQFREINKIFYIKTIPHPTLKEAQILDEIFQRLITFSTFEGQYGKKKKGRKNASSWNRKDVSKWLREINMEWIVPRFLSKKINGPLLTRFSPTELTLIFKDEKDPSRLRDMRRLRESIDFLKYHEGEFDVGYFNLLRKLSKFDTKKSLHVIEGKNQKSSFTPCQFVEKRLKKTGFSTRNLIDPVKFRHHYFRRSIGTMVRIIPDDMNAYMASSGLCTSPKFDRVRPRKSSISKIATARDEGYGKRTNGEYQVYLQSRKRTSLNIGSYNSSYPKGMCGSYDSSLSYSFDSTNSSLARDIFGREEEEEEEEESEKSDVGEDEGGMIFEEVDREEEDEGEEEEEEEGKNMRILLQIDNRRRNSSVTSTTSTESEIGLKPELAYPLLGVHYESDKYCPLKIVVMEEVPSLNVENIELLIDPVWTSKAEESFLKKNYSVRKVDSKFNNFKTAILFGPWFLEWSESEIIVPKRLQCMNEIITNIVCKEVSFTIKQNVPDLEEKLKRLSEYCCRLNSYGTYPYDEEEIQCHLDILSMWKPPKPREDDQRGKWFVENEESGELEFKEDIFKEVLDEYSVQLKEDDERKLKSKLILKKIYSRENFRRSDMNCQMFVDDVLEKVFDVDRNFLEGSLRRFLDSVARDGRGEMEYVTNEPMIVKFLGENEEVKEKFNSHFDLDYFVIGLVGDIDLDLMNMYPEDYHLLKVFDRAFWIRFFIAMDLEEMLKERKRKEGIDYDKGELDDVFMDLTPRVSTYQENIGKRFSRNLCPFQDPRFYREEKNKKLDDERIEREIFGVNVSKLREK